MGRHRLAAALAVAASTVSLASALHGVDVSTPVSLTAAKCMLQQRNVTYGVARAWHSYGGFDANCLSTAISWWDAGFTDVDFYMFPCSFRDARSQVSQLLGNLTGNARYGRIWLDIETNTSPGCGWSSNKTANCGFLGELVEAVQLKGIPVGIYASYYMWTSWMTDSATPNGCPMGDGSKGGIPLWYAHYDNKTTFADFEPFGGWSVPSLKQYWDTNTDCGVGVDDSWAPGDVPPQ